jgi:hypothetical protein
MPGILTLRAGLFLHNLSQLYCSIAQGDLNFYKKQAYHLLMKSKFHTYLVTTVVLALLPTQMLAVIDVLVVAADGTPPDTELEAFAEINTVTTFDASLGTPDLATLGLYDAVLVYSDSAFDAPILLGNRLADYVDAGGGLVIATLSLSPSGLSPDRELQGAIMNPGYNPLIPNSTTQPAGGINALVPSDSIFDDIDLNAVTFSVGSLPYANPTLDTGATLLADDGNGVNMIARNASGNVYAVNIFPTAGLDIPSTETFELYANILDAAAVPEPKSVALVFGLVGGLCLIWRRRR